MKIFKSKDITMSLLKTLTRQGLGDVSAPREQVLRVLQNVQNNGDGALCEYTQKFDGVSLTARDLRVSEDKLQKAQVSSQIEQALGKAKENIERYQKLLLPSGDVRDENNGVMLGARYIRLDRVGVYVPGGSAPLVSTVLMTVLPAKVAGVKEVVVASPPTHNGNIHPAILYACRLCGVSEVYRVGGAQAIAAMAFGSETISPVDKIVGPGNLYVTLAKKEVFGTVDIDMIAGPSEIMVVADEQAPIDWVVYDLMSQAEHDPLAASYLVCFDEDYAEQVVQRFEELRRDRSRKDVIERSWQDHGHVFVVKDNEQASEVINAIAPEHLELMVRDAESFISHVKHAGAIFIGNYTPEAVGDYFAGPSHVLPTSGSARFFSPLSVMSFLKTSSLLSYSEEAFRREGAMMAALADLEGLDAHAQSVNVRLDKGE